jgi:hypothetical protein
MPRILGGKDEPSTVSHPSGVGWGPLPPAPTLTEAVKEKTPDELERIRMCEHHANLLSIQAKLDWHASETARLIEERKAEQDGLRDIMARFGIATK